MENREREQPGKEHWNTVAVNASRGLPLDVWRAYMRRVYLRLVNQWFSRDDSGYVLKTDLFEEAVSPHNLLPDLGARPLGIDTSPTVVGVARERLSKRGVEPSLIIGDLRQLPLRSSGIKQILSGSSLDHFVGKADIARSLEELSRVLMDGGVLVITFDNPHNPAVWLRNRLPFLWLNRVHLVPYYVGATYKRDEARHQLEAVGLIVTNTTAVVHAPRVFAIALVGLAERFGWTWLGALLSRCLDRFEIMESWPTRFLTGYYLAFRAEKRPNPSRA